MSGSWDWLSHLQRSREVGGLGETSKFPHTNHKRSAVRSHTLAPTSICDLSHSLCWSPLTDLGPISSVSYVCHPLWFVCGHRKGILMSPLTESCSHISSAAVRWAGHRIWLSHLQCSREVGGSPNLVVASPAQQ